MPDKVPLWIIRNTFCPSGDRLPKRPPIMSGTLHICATCQRELYHHQDWNYCETLYYCNGCIADAREEARKNWNQMYGGRVVPITGFDYVRNIPAKEEDIPSGNLNENDYVFWIGSTERYTGGAKSLRAVCRACNQDVWGEVNRSAHKITSSKFYKGGLSCAKVLALCYQQLLKLDRCMVCGFKCFGKQKWGVSLCCPNCIKIWKFEDTTEYPDLDRAIMQFWASESSGSGTSESTSSQTQMSTLEEPKG